MRLKQNKRVKKEEKVIRYRCEDGTYKAKNKERTESGNPDTKNKSTRDAIKAIKRCEGVPQPVSWARLSL